MGHAGAGGEPIRPAQLIARQSQTPEVSMKLAKLVLAGSLFIGFASAASAQQTLTGTVTMIDRMSGTMAIQQTQSGTVGSSGGVERQFKASDDLLENVHAGDRVTVSVGESDGKKTITKIESR
jgi:Cu/Ag efflux protein CusF